MSTDFVNPTLKRRASAWLLNLLFIGFFIEIVKCIPSIAEFATSIALFTFWIICASSTSSPGKKVLSIFVRRNEFFISWQDHFLRSLPSTLLLLSFVAMDLSTPISNDYLKGGIGIIVILSGLLFLANLLVVIFDPEHRSLTDMRLHTRVSRLRPLTSLKPY